jgi:hypothetical protein
MLLALSAGLVCLAATTASAGAGSITTLVKEGDAIPGVGNVTLIDNVAVNDSGEWIVEVDTDFANTEMDQVLVKNSAVFIREDQALPDPPGSRVGSFDSVNLNNNGHSGWNFFLAGTNGTFDDSGIFYDTTLVIQESDTSTALDFSAGTPYIGFFDAKANNANQIMIVASVDDPAIPTTVDRALVIALHDGAGGLLGESVLMKEGDVPPGEADSVADFGTGPHESAFNDNGNILFFADLTGNTATDGTIYCDALLIAQEGSPSPVTGRNYELLSGRGLDLNNGLGHVFKANLDGATTDDELIVRNDEVFVREGEGLPAIAPFTFTAFGLTSGPVQISDPDQRVLWFGDWNDPDTNVDTGLFLDSMLIVQEGVTTIDGVVVDEIANGTDAFVMSDNGLWAVFEATLVGGISGAFRIALPGNPTGVDAPAPASAPGRFALRVLGPSPLGLGSSLGFAYDVPSPGADVSIRVFDASGRRVASLVDGRVPPGSHVGSWSPDAEGRLASGVYFLRLEAGAFRTSDRIVLVR